jgi:hypothetical protein
VIIWCVKFDGRKLWYVTGPKQDGVVVCDIIVVGGYCGVWQGGGMKVCVKEEVGELGVVGQDQCRRVQ